MQLDINRYRHFVDRFDMHEEAKVAVLTQVWGMMGSFVDRAFGDAPEQQLRMGLMGNQRGTSAAKQLETLASESTTALDCEEPLTPTFNDAARPKPPARKRRR
ncbi:hypothetical protein V5740_03295 [Croceibacterium sp. TMG7-5b_MA50]|uniref:hypothetical protein n=1 Tax=Croceibacterium sp. TMG7-5b_MA50 TaxID=3121290 RepID=UPI003221BF5D